MSILLFSLWITAPRYREDLRKPFDISLKGSFQLINVVIPPVARTKKDTRSIYTVTGREREKNGGNLSKAVYRSRTADGHLF